MSSRYEDELWRELVAREGEPPDGDRPPEPPWRPRGPWAAAGGIGLVAVAATGAVFAYSAISAPTPAYAVTRNHDGSVRVWLRATSGIRGLNARLKAMNVPAQAVLVAGGCPPSPALAAAALHARGRVAFSRHGRLLRPAAATHMHILLVRRGVRGAVSLSDVIARSTRGGRVPSCAGQVPVDVGRNDGPPRAIVVRPLVLRSAVTCAAAARAQQGSLTATAPGATTTGTSTASAAPPTTGASTAATATPTTGASTAATATTGATSSKPPLALRGMRCCPHVVTAGATGTTGTATVTSGATTNGTATVTTGAGHTTRTTAAGQTPSAAQTTTVGGTTMSALTGTQTTVPIGAGACRLLRAVRVSAPPTASTRTTATTRPTGTSTSSSGSGDAQKAKRR